MYEIKNIYEVKCGDTWHTIIASNLDECVSFLKSYWQTKDTEPSLIKLVTEYALLATKNENINKDKEKIS
jgi:transposase